MSTHNICFRGEIRKIFTWYLLFYSSSRPMILCPYFVSLCSHVLCFRYMSRDTWKSAFGAYVNNEGPDQCTVWSGPELSAYRIIRYCRIHQTKAMALIRLYSFNGRSIYQPVRYLLSGCDSYMFLSYDIAVNQWITSCHKNRMTTHYITLWQKQETSWRCPCQPCIFCWTTVNFKGNKIKFKMVIW